MHRQCTKTNVEEGAAEQEEEEEKEEKTEEEKNTGVHRRPKAAYSTVLKLLNQRYHLLPCRLNLAELTPTLLFVNMLWKTQEGGRRQ